MLIVVLCFFDFKHKGIITWSGVREGNGQAIGMALPFQRSVMPQQADRGNLAQGIFPGAQGPNGELFSFRPVQGDGIKGIALCRKADILAAPGFIRFGILTGLDLRGPFPEFDPGTGVIDGFPVQVQPTPDLFQFVQEDLGDGTVCLWTDVEK